MAAKPLTHRQNAQLPARVLNRFDLRQGSRTTPVPSAKRKSAKGGRQGARRAVRAEVGV